MHGSFIGINLKSWSRTGSTQILQIRDTLFQHEQPDCPILFGPMLSALSAQISSPYLTWGELYFLIKPIRCFFPRMWVSRRAALRNQGSQFIFMASMKGRKEQKVRCRGSATTASQTWMERKEQSLQPVLKSFYCRDRFLRFHSSWNLMLFTLLGEAEKWIICTLLWIPENVWPLESLSPIYVPWPLVSNLLWGSFGWLVVLLSHVAFFVL